MAVLSNLFHLPHHHHFPAQHFFFKKTPEQILACRQIARLPRDSVFAGFERNVFQRSHNAPVGCQDVEMCRLGLGGLYQKRRGRVHRVGDTDDAVVRCITGVVHGARLTRLGSGHVLCHLPVAARKGDDNGLGINSVVGACRQRYSHRASRAGGRGDAEPSRNVGDAPIATGVEHQGQFAARRREIEAGGVDAEHGIERCEVGFPKASTIGGRAEFSGAVADFQLRDRGVGQACVEQFPTGRARLPAVHAHVHANIQHAAAVWLDGDAIDGQIGQSR